MHTPLYCTPENTIMPWVDVRWVCWYVVLRCGMESSSRTKQRNDRQHPSIASAVGKQLGESVATNSHQRISVLSAAGECALFSK